MTPKVSTLPLRPGSDDLFQHVAGAQHRLAVAHALQDDGVFGAVRRQPDQAVLLAVERDHAPEVARFETEHRMISVELLALIPRRIPQRSREYASYLPRCQNRKYVATWRAASPSMSKADDVKRVKVKVSSRSR